MATITILKFWTGTEKNAKGETAPVDWVRWRPPLIDGQPSKSANEEKVRRLDPKNVRIPEGAEPGEKIKHMEAMWSVIGPAYDAWKAGNGIPDNGTPIGIWPAIDPDTADTLRMAGYRTIEAIAELKDYEAIKLPVGNGRELPKLAQLYLEGQDTAAAAAREQGKDARIAALEARLAEMDKGAADNEVDDLRVKLDGLGVAYDKRYGAPKLREILAGFEAEAA